MKLDDNLLGIPDDGNRYLRRIVVFGLMVHSFLILNDGIFSDDWSYWMLAVTGDWESFQKLWVDLGLAHLQYLYYPMFRYMDPFLVGRIMITLAIILTACSLFIICRNNLKIPAWESWVIAMLTVSYPIYNLYVQIAMTHYAVPLGLFCLGWALYLNWQTKRPLLKSTLIYSLWALSLYSYNSLFSIYFSFVLMMWFVWKDREKPVRESIIYSTPQFLRHHWFLVGFPFVVYFLKRTAGKPGGSFTGYNEIIFLKASLFEGIKIFFHAFQRNIIGTIKELIRISGQLLFPGFWAVFLVLLVALFLANKKYKFLGSPSSSTHWLNAHNVIVGAAFLVLAVIPYAMVGKYVYPANGFRHVLALGFPLSLGFVMGVSYVQAKVKKSIPNFSLYCCITLVLLGGGACAYKYCLWQDRWVVDRATIETLKNIQPPRPGTILFYKNPFYRKIEKKDAYRIYELSGILYYGWNGSRWMGVHDLKAPTHKSIEDILEQVNAFDDEARARNGLMDFQPNGCASTFTIIPAEQGERGWISLRYWLHKLIWKDQMEDFLKSILTVEIKGIPYKKCPNLHPQ